MPDRGRTKFVDGAWIVLVLLPLAVLLLLRLHRQYRQEDAELEHEAELAATASILRRHVVLVLIDRLDRSTARAIQYARPPTPDELRAVHIAADEPKAEALADEWRRLGLSRRAWSWSTARTGASPAAPSTSSTRCWPTGRPR